VDPLDRDQNDSGNAASGGNEPTHAIGMLGDSDDWLRFVVQNSSEIITVVDPDGTLMYASPAYERILGCDPGEALGKNMFDSVHLDDLSRILEETERVTSADDPGGTNVVEYRFRHKAGSWRWMEGGFTNRQDDPAVGGIVVNARDITERKGSEERLRQAEERYRTLVEQIPVVAYIDRADGSDSPLYTSPQIEGLLGYTPDPSSGSRLWRERLHPEDRERVLAADECFEREGQERFGGEYRLLAKDGSVVWVLEDAVLVKDTTGSPLYWQGILYDITERKLAEEQREHRAFHDTLTDLPNRRLFLDRLGHALSRTEKGGSGQVAVLFMDLERFKVINDSLGHEVGDLVLVAVAERLTGCLRPEDTLARFGGDEFVMLVEDVESPEQAMRVAERIHTDVRESPLVLEGRQMYVGASMGIALGTARTKSAEDLLRDADTAMYRAKDGGLGYSVFNPAMYEWAVRRLKLENDLRRAVEWEEFVLHYQPIFDLGSQGVWGVEALVRWKHPERGLLGPSEFVAVAEETSLIVPMGRWVLEEACRRTKEWHQSYPRSAPLRMIVNFSATQLRHPRCVGNIEEALKRSGLGAESLSLDITESAFLDALEGDALILKRIEKLGVRIFIDDFGTGYSSLSYLKHLSANAIKIDKSFVASLGEDVENTAIVRMVVDLAHTLRMEAIAEGVESEEQARLLRGMGCDFAQGYHWQRPCSAEKIEELLAAGFNP
jgi:diguanylate cyclase (GGDEF)-like protein/PAS domain S-box-containing protein